MGGNEGRRIWKEEKRMNVMEKDRIEQQEPEKKNIIA